MRQTLLIFTTSLLLFSRDCPAKPFSPADVPWLATVKASGVESFQVCGSDAIQPTKAALKAHFMLGPTRQGYLLTGLLNTEQYFQLLTEKKLTEAKAALEAEINKAHLWVYSKAQGMKDLGKPTKVELPFTATVKDCIEGARTSAGNDCSQIEAAERQGCCREKFIGPVIYWGGHRLMYSPDPSVRLKVAGEKKHRYCNVQEETKVTP